MSYIEKEKLIKADIASIENRVRHAFNQGYDLGYKEGKANCSKNSTGSTTKNDLAVDWESYKDVDGNCLDDLILEVLQNNFDCGNTYGYKVADEIIGLLPSVTPQEPKWIPISERLPENKETVLVTFKHFVSGNTIGLGSVILLRGKPHWHVREQNLGTYDVLAWMPLPKRYGEVEE